MLHEAALHHPIIHMYVEIRTCSNLFKCFKKFDIFNGQNFYEVKKFILFSYYINIIYSIRIYQDTQYIFRTNNIDN